MDSAVSSTSVISAASRSCMLRRSLRFQAIWLALRRFLDNDAVDSVVFLEHDGDGFTTARRQVLADVVGADGQLPMAAVDEHGQPDDARAAKVHQRVHRGSDRPPGEEHVVHQDHDASFDREADLGGTHLRLLGLEAEIVSVEGDVERADRGLRAFDGGDLLGDALGKGDPARLDANQRNVLHALGLFDDLVRDPRQRAIEAGLVQDLSLFPVGRHDKEKCPWRGAVLQEKCPSRGTGLLVPYVEYFVMLLLAGLPGPLKGVDRDAGSHYAGLSVAVKGYRANVVSPRA